MLRREVCDRRWSRGNCCIGRVAGVGVSGVQGVRRLCHPPGHLLEVETIIDNPASPDVNQTCVVGCSRTTNVLKAPSRKGDTLLTFSGELLRSNVRFASTQASGHVDRALPRQSVYGGSTIVSDLEKSQRKSWTNISERSTFKCPFKSKKRFSGLISRWATPWLCK